MNRALNGENVDAGRLLSVLDTTYGDLFVQESQNIAYRILKIDMDHDNDPEWLVHFYDTVDFPFHIIALMDQIQGNPVCLGMARNSTEGMYDMSMPIIDTASATIWMKVNTTGACMGGFFYHVFAIRNGLLQEVNTFPGKYGMSSCGTKNKEGHEQYWLIDSRYESNPAYNVIYGYSDLVYGVTVEKAGKFNHIKKLEKKDLMVRYVLDRREGFTCTDVYGKEIPCPFDSKDFYDLYQKAIIGQYSPICAGKTREPYQVGSTIQQQIKVKRHIIKTSLFHYAVDSLEMRYLFNKRTVWVNGNKFDIDRLYRQNLGYDLFESCYFSGGIELHEFIDRDEVHIPLFISGCCCGNCNDYPVINIQLWKNGKVTIDFFDHPPAEYWSI